MMAFRLRDGVDREAFRALDARVQTEFAYQQPGLLRRTTACSADGEWLIVRLWDTDAHVEAAHDYWRNSPLSAEFIAYVQVDSIRPGRYETLD
jgi:hypothetical protein